MFPKINPNHKRRVPKRSKRGQFSAETREKIIERDKGICQECGSKGTEIHHVVFKSQSGRGVYTNGLLLCSLCHKDIHRIRALADKWISEFLRRYGKDFYKDEWDVCQK